MSCEHTLALYVGSGGPTFPNECASSHRLAKGAGSDLAPDLIIHGDRDPFYHTDTMLYVQSLIPKSKLVVMEGSRHLPAMTRPMDVAKTINEFFNGSSD